jgi:cyanophycinase
MAFEMPHPAGTLVAIGGAEDKTRNRAILRFVAERVGPGPLVVLTAASAEPDAAWRLYRKAFRNLGVRSLQHVDVRDRRQAFHERISRAIDGARGVFFTGGDQARIASNVADTPVCERVGALLARGGVVAGTSAGACVMSDNMLVSGDGHGAPAGAVQMGRGLGFVSDVVIDMHFSQRGRMGRLLAAIARHPGTLGIGIDEDTAIAVAGDTAEVIGSGAAWFVDGARASASNNARAAEPHALSIEDLRLDVLGAGRRYDLADRRPVVDRRRERRGRAA